MAGSSIASAAAESACGRQLTAAATTTQGKLGAGRVGSREQAVGASAATGDGRPSWEQKKNEANTKTDARCDDECIR